MVASIHVCHTCARGRNVHGQGLHLCAQGGAAALPLTSKTALQGPPFMNLHHEHSSCGCSLLEAASGCMVRLGEACCKLAKNLGCCRLST
jgi:hypothetical protein